MTEYGTLKYTRPMMHGSAVVRLQEMLDLLGFDGGPNDGVYDPSTERMVAKFQEFSGLKVDGVCGPKTWAEIIARIDSGDSRSLRINTDRYIVDRRNSHPLPKLYKCERPWSKITGVTLHQTGCNMPQIPSGWDRVNAHIGINQKGVAILINDPANFIWHAQGLSASTVGIEIEGNYCGIDGDMSTLWRGGGGPYRLNDAMIGALEQVRSWLVDQFSKNGSQWEHIYAHRQSKDTRIADPGEEIWRSVAEEWAEKLGIDLSDTAFEIFGSGRPIPEQWNGYGCDYNCKPGGK